jgi:hypothetical protein
MRSKPRPEPEVIVALAIITIEGQPLRRTRCVDRIGSSKGIAGLKMASRRLWVIAKRKISSDSLKIFQNTIDSYNGKLL